MRAILLSSVAVAGCTTPNPRSCADGNCTDPAFPYCDLDGSLAGTPKSCIAVECTPGEVAQCQGSEALTCNALGGDYDLVHCDHGCDLATGGCRLCEPNETACTNGKVATCDAKGQPTVTETCALGCFEDEPRCRELVPSNNLGIFAAMVQNPPDLNLSNAYFDPATGVVSVAGQPVTVPSFLAAPAGNGVAIRVFVVNSLTLTSASLGNRAETNPRDPAIAFMAKRNIVLRGELIVSSLTGGANTGCRPAGPGVFGATYASGGGGGANATDGADGGLAAGIAGGLHDTASGTAVLVPLRGGCSGGDPGMTNPIAPNGGGALQLSAGGTIDIDATIDVRGQEGTYWANSEAQNGPSGSSGGGAGGSVLIEAAKVTLGPDAKLLASGGNGFTFCPSPGCAAAGVGATAVSPATKGGDASVSGGGGGGGLGRVRINTSDANYTKTSSTVEDAVVTTGTVQTR